MTHKKLSINFNYILITMNYDRQIFFILLMFLYKIILFFSALKDNSVLTTSTSHLNNTVSLSKLPFTVTTSLSSRNDSNRSYRNTNHNYSTSHYQQQTTSSYSTYKRRMTNYQNNSSSSRYNGNHYKYNSSFRSHRSSEICDKENNSTTKPLFNEGLY